MKIFTIIAAGGRGARMGVPKQLMPLLGKPMLQWTVEAFRKVREITDIIIATADENIPAAKKLSNLVCKSGLERQDSVANALTLVPDDADIVLIHDGARPLITPEIIKASIEACKKYDAVVVGVPVKDTMKQVENGSILKTLARNSIWQAQTPQVFKYDIIKKAQAQAKAKVTDDSMLVEDLGIPVKIIMGSYENIKITTPEDIAIAEAILNAQFDKKRIH